MCLCVRACVCSRDRVRVYGVPPGAERRMLATNIFRKLEGKWVLVHHHASQATVRSNSIEDLLGGASGARVIRIDGSTQGDGHLLRRVGGLRAGRLETTAAGSRRSPRRDHRLACCGSETLRINGGTLISKGS